MYVDDVIVVGLARDIEVNLLITRNVFTSLLGPTAVAVAEEIVRAVGPSLHYKGDNRFLDDVITFTVKAGSYGSDELFSYGYRGGSQQVSEHIPGDEEIDLNVPGQSHHYNVIHVHKRGAGQTMLNLI